MRGLVVVCGALVLGCGGGSDERDEEILLAWLACDECIDGEFQMVLDSLGPRALPALREALLGSLDDAVENVEALAESEFDTGVRQGPDTVGFVAAAGDNLRALYQRRSILALAALGDTVTLREAFEQRTANGYRADVVAALEQALGQAGAPGFQPPAVATVLVRPDTTSAAPGDSVVFEAIARDVDGRLVEAALTWTVAGGGAAIVSPVPARGVVRLPLAASGTVVATAQAASGASGTGEIFVGNPPSPAGTLIIVSGDGQSGPTGTTAAEELTVELRDAQGVPVSGVTVSWRIERPGVAAQNVVNATLATGRAALTVSYGAQPGRVAVVASAPGAAPVRFRLRALPP